jgi:two-component system sensor histidine kinase UhpB
MASKQVGTSVVTLIVLSIGVVCLINGGRRVGVPFPGFLVAENHIVVSIGRRGWSLEKADRSLFAKIIAIEGRPIVSSTDVDAFVAQRPVGTPVAYRFRKEAEVFASVIEVQLFGLADFLALYATYFVTGACFVLIGWWVFRRVPAAPPALPFFTLCQLAGLAILTGGDVYGPYWFTSLYFTAYCLFPAAVFHFASSFPEPIDAPVLWRRLILTMLYAGALAAALVLNRVADEPSLFLPLIYTVYLVMANALLLYCGRLAITLWSSTDERTRHGLWRAVAGIVGSATVPGIIFVIYPVLKEPISPVVLVAPMGIFPVLTASALRAIGDRAPGGPRGSVRQRLSLLFLGAVETAFLAGIAVFWLNNSWKQLIDDLALNQQQQLLIEHVSPPATPTVETLAAIDALVQTVAERALVDSAIHAATQRDTEAAREAIHRLGQRYRRTHERLDARRQRLSRIDAALVLGLVVAGIAQALAFAAAIQRWLIRPVDELAAGTSVIATGDLGHRIESGATGEFRALADAINTMAASLAAIQQRIEAEREERRLAAGTARDAERRRLARELHDGVLQDLSAVKLQLEGAAKTSASPQVQPAIDAMIETIVGLRRVVDDLGAPELTHKSLREALGAYAHAVANGHGTTLQLDLSDEAPIADWASRDVFRIAQEALTNAVRHGAPGHLALRLYAAAQRTVLEIADDGSGFDVRTVALGTGIRGMRERAAAIGANLDILTTPGAGTTVRLTLPRPPKTRRA